MWNLWLCLRLTLVAVSCANLGNAVIFPADDFPLAEPYRDECPLETESIEVPIGSPQKLIGVHVRSNIEGEVEIRDGERGSKKIRIELEKIAPAESDLDYIIINQSLVDVGTGTIFVLQLDFVQPDVRSSHVPIVSAATVLIVVLLGALLLVLYLRRRRRQNFSPVHAPAYSEGGAETQDSTLDGEDCSTSVAQDEADVASSVHEENDDTQVFPPPPPPRRVDPTYMSASEFQGSPTKTSGGVSSPRGLSKAAVVSLTVVAMVSLVFASCTVKPGSKVIIVIPPELKLDAINLFFNENNQNEVNTENWFNKNATQFYIFDLKVVKPTTKPPCFAKKVCHNAHNQNLAGCDAAVQQCVCQRGYSFKDGICIDVDECGSSRHGCPVTSTCQNLIGGFVCRCGYGFYGVKKSCKRCVPARDVCLGEKCYFTNPSSDCCTSQLIGICDMNSCSVGCPQGHYQAEPCTNSGDRTCKVCSECTGSMYEARPCTATKDRHCIHVAHPLLIAENKTTPSFLEGLKVETSDNVFSEDLHSTRNLETISYVTDTTQAQDFYWKRESGLRVNIGILNVHLMPEYEDVSHEGDNFYMIQNPNNSEDKKRFQQVVDNDCRNPIPDSYSITLEISRDRATSATMVECDSKNPTKPPCPPGYSDGDTFLHRTLNEPCRKMGTFPDALTPAPNSIVCVDNTPLLSEIFNQTYTIERPIPFPPPKCRTAQSRCQQCLNQATCRQTDVFEQKCCQKDCYTLADCKLTYSPDCSKAPIECAMGDAYRYTIQPVYRHITQEFQCHISLRRPRILYQLFYFVEIPGLNFQTPKVYRTVYAQDLKYQSHGEYEADYITVEHDIGIDLKDEFIMVGRKIPDSSRVNYTVHSLKQEEEFKKKKVVIHDISTNIFVASTQFERPFDYSSTSWVINNQCNKNVSKFKYVQKMYNSETQSVSIIKERSDDSFRYFLKSLNIDNPPYIRFTVPGNTSILPYYFRGNGPLLIKDSSLTAVLELTAAGKIWNIHIHGKMTNCPAYLGVVINDRIDLEEFFRHDLLILCPVDFNLTFNIPNRGMKPDKTFDVHLEDAKSTYDIYLTHMLFEQEKMEKDPEPLMIPSSPELSVTMFAAVGGLTLVVLLTMLGIYIYTETTRVKLVYDNSKEMRSIYVPNGSQKRSSDCCISAGHLSRGQIVFIGMYVFFRVIYSLLFTFTVFFAILFLLVQPDLETLSRMEHLQQNKLNESHGLSQMLDRYGSDELLRQDKAANAMQGACSNYVSDLVHTLTANMNNITASQPSLAMYSQKSSISFLMHQKIETITTKYRHQLENFTTNYQTMCDDNIDSLITNYKRYLKKIHSSNWFNFPLRLFNLSSYGNERPPILRTNNKLTGSEVDFGAFLEIEEVEEAQLWPIQFSERYDRTLPDLPALPIPRLDRHSPHCYQRGPRSNLTSEVPSQRSDASHYYSNAVIPPEQPEEPRFKLTSTYTAEEHKNPMPGDDQLSYSLLFSIDYVVQSVNTELLRIIFLIIDAILLIYRFSHTYINSSTLCRGFEETSMGRHGEAVPDAYRNGNSSGNADSKRPADDRTTDHPFLREEKDGMALQTVPTYMSALHCTTSNTYPPRHHNNGTSVQRLPGASHRSENKWKKGNWDILKYTICNMIQNSTVPKIIVAYISMVLIYIIVTAVFSVIDINVLLGTSDFSVVLQGFDTHADQINWYLSDQAAHFNNVTLKALDESMKSEVLNLQSMMEYFNTEQARLAENYKIEACLITKQVLTNWTCAIDIEPPEVSIPMLPCNFVPVQPLLFTDFQKERYKLQIGQDVFPFFSAARNVVLKSSYATLCVISVVLLIHTIGAVIFHCLKTRHKFPVRTIQVTSALPSASEAHSPPAEESEEESDNEGGFQTYASLAHQRLGSPQKFGTMSSDFGYSETKV